MQPNFLQLNRDKTEIIVIGEQKERQNIGSLKRTNCSCTSDMAWD
uniref:Uncharacterized protein n=1 Tax=Anguilla anguilla TaxID=7936 RepID=A0A0E9TM99_ANGAN